MAKLYQPVVNGVMTRQRRRHELRALEYKIVRNEFDLPRRISRAIARTRAHNKFKAERAQ